MAQYTSDEADDYDCECRATEVEREPESAEDRLRRAAEHIDATELHDGQWAHYADETGRWYVVTDDELASLCDYLDDEYEQVSRDAYSYWCAGTMAEEMPADWAPEVMS